MARQGMSSKKSEIPPCIDRYLGQFAKRIRKRFDVSVDFSNRLLGLFLVGLVALLLLICASFVPLE